MIQGSGSVSATGGISAAGIGSGKESDCGVVRIRSGSVTARSNSHGAGIGSGWEGEVCTIRISGGTVYAEGGMNGAGIGTGACRDEGKADILISGGSVTARAGSYAAGIGGGMWTNCGTTQISGGYVDATGYDAPAIGNGGGTASVEVGGTVDITGGIVFAHGVSSVSDIGSSAIRTIGSVTISGDAGVFLRNDEIDALTTTHTHMGM